jgi:hypothetical protein
MNPRLLGSFPSGDGSTLEHLIHTLFGHQLASWPQLQIGYEGLHSVRSRSVTLGSDTFFVQFNPRRIVSTGARVDPKSISERKCFLCQENLSPEQKGIGFRDQFLILGNPFPIVDSHLTIPNMTHTPQMIAGYMSVLLDLARTLSHRFTVFYNGPNAGASAPDHMHFQACPREHVPVETALDCAPLQTTRTIGGTTIATVTFAGQRIVSIAGKNADALCSVFDLLLEAGKRVMGAPAEPLMNVFCSWLDGTWRLIVFLRRKHRPDIFYREGDDRLVISPAALDVGGVIVTPLEKDFERMDAAMVKSIWNEVLALDSDVEQILASL